jgi:NADH-quinone oxidoreductase subunit C
MSTDVIAALQQRFPQQLLGVHRYREQGTAVLRREGLLDVARFLRDDPALRFDVLMDVTCVDYLKFGKSLSSAPTLATPAPLPYYMPPKPSGEAWERLPAAPGSAQAGPVSNDEFRFDVVYHLYSTRHQHRVRLKVPVALADPSVASLTSLWASANWFEREVWDMFGVTFTGHPDLRRILMYDSFKGHPLRKDYPVRKRQPLIGPVN